MSASKAYCYHSKMFLLTVSFIDFVVWYVVKKGVCEREKMSLTFWGENNSGPSGGFLREKGLS